MAGQVAQEGHKPSVCTGKGRVPKAQARGLAKEGARPEEEGLCENTLYSKGGLN